MAKVQLYADQSDFYVPVGQEQTVACYGQWKNQWQELYFSNKDYIVNIKSFSLTVDDDSFSLTALHVTQS